MKVLIVEDEPLAVERLKQLLQQQSEQIEVVGVTGSIESSVEWLKSIHLHSLS